MNRELLIALTLSLAMTLVLEVAFFLIIGKRNKKDLLLVIMVNVLTNPIVVLIYWLAYLYTNWNIVIVLIPLEIFAVLTEAVYYKKYGQSFKRPLVFAFAANVFSFAIGFLIQRL